MYLYFTSQSDFSILIKATRIDHCNVAKVKAFVFNILFNQFRCISVS